MKLWLFAILDRIVLGRAVPPMDEIIVMINGLSIHPDYTVCFVPVVRRFGVSYSMLYVDHAAQHRRIPGPTFRSIRRADEYKEALKRCLDRKLWRDGYTMHRVEDEEDRTP